MESLLALYKSILHSLDLKEDAEGRLSMMLGDDPYPCTVDNKRLVLPTREVLRNPDWNANIAFHPLSENIAREQSPVLKKMRHLVNMRLTTSIAIQLVELMSIAADTNSHKTLSPKQSAMLTVVPDVDEKTVEVLRKVIETIDPVGKNRLVNVYLARGGTVKGRKWSRLASVVFPIVKEFDGEENVIYGVKMRKKDKIAIIALLNWLIPGIDTEDTYSVGSSSMIAPYFDSLMGAFITVSDRLNTVAKMFKASYTDYDSAYIKLSWAKEFSDLEKFKEMIPSLDGNDGDMIDKRGVVADDEATVAVKRKEEAMNESSSETANGLAPWKPKPLGRPLNDTGSKDVSKSSTGLVRREGDDWGQFVANMNKPVFNTFKAVGRPGPMFTQNVQNYQPMPSFSHQPQYGHNTGPAMRTFNSVGGRNDIPSGPRDDSGWSKQGTVSSV